MVLRKPLLRLAFLGPVVFVGCGSGITNENVPEKVITAEDMDRARQQMESLQGQGVKASPGPPERGVKKTSRSGRQ
jgi:hypothetical protein